MGEKIEVSHKDFVERSRKVHGDEYEYEDTYKGMNNPIYISCKEHGDFKTTPSRHIHAKSICPVCNKINKELEKRKRYQDKISQKHGDKYVVTDWLELKGTADEVVVECKDHGEYKTTFYSAHKTSHGGCPACKSLEESEVFINKAQKLHKGKYVYKNEDYVCSRTLMNIFCTKHKSTFSQRPSAHLQGQGCPLCGKEDAITNSRSNQEEFLLKCKEVHGDKLDYTKVVYECNYNPVTIVCDMHGDFSITPRNLLSGTGCVECKKEANRKFHEDKFLQKVTNESKYQHLDFSKASYVNNRTSVDIYCKDHNEWFKRTPNKILDEHSSIGCSTCNKLSINRWTIKSVLSIPNIKEKYGYIYTGSITRINGTKIGITSDRSARLSTYKRDLEKYNTEFKYTNYRKLKYLECVIAETILKKFYSKSKVEHSMDFGGKNEVYDIKNTNLIDDLQGGVWDEKLKELALVVDSSKNKHLVAFINEIKKKERYTNE